MLNFSYLIPGVLAGSSMPLGRQDLERLVDQGIEVLVTAMEESLDENLANDVGLEYHYYPVPPFGTPTLQQINDFVDLVNTNRIKNRPVAIHCYMGWGRTGTLLAAYLISEGMSADEAIVEVRKKRSGSIETRGQEQILHRYAQTLATRR
ncbi:MAG: dual specificity protein phosphatase family protein [Promethearchaeota archaeon]